MPEGAPLRTGDVNQDRILGHKIHQLGLVGHEQDFGEQEQPTDPRSRRLALEDRLLAQDPRQRKMLVLDYIRRGRLLQGVEIMPELIQLAPALVDSGAIDFTSDQYDPQQTIQYILGQFEQVRQEVLKTDERVRKLLAEFGLTVQDRRYLDASWHGQLLKVLKEYQVALERPNPRHPAVARGDLETYKVDILNRSVAKLDNQLAGDVSELFRQYVGDPKKFSIDFSKPNPEDRVQQFIWANSKEPFFRYPIAEEYRGERIQSPPDFSEIRVKPGVRVIERDTVPVEPGGIIFDGNFGYDAEGKLITPEDKIVLDHHDALNEKQYDTATVMATRFWQERLGKKFSIQSWKEELRKLQEDGVVGEKAKAVTMVNDPDVDAVLAVWVFRNPRKAEQYTELLHNISFCGDFLTGSRIMEFGANARDYNYIIMNYLEACREKIQQEKRLPLEMQKADLEQRRDKIKSQLNGINESREAVRQDPDVMALQAELDAHKRNQPNPAERKAWVDKLRELNAALDKLVNEKLGNAAGEEQRVLQEEMKQIEGEIIAITKEIKNFSQAALTSEDNAKIVSHFLDVMEDIIRNPFKYQQFLQQGREAEERGLQQVEQWYRDGTIEITSSEDDPDVLILRPLKGKSMPRPESIDGMYFFLRRRLDFNKKIIINLDGASYMVAINTQDRGELKKYDFNELVPTMRVREEELLQQQLEAKERELEQIDPSKKPSVEKEVAKLQELLQRNRQGRLWRNRNQMAFVFRSVISSEEYLDRVHEWKKLEDEKLLVDKLSKTEVGIRLASLRADAASEVDRLRNLGQWPSTGSPDSDHQHAIESIVGRIPEGKGTFAGFDAGVACSLDLIPREKQKLSAELHVRYSPEAVAQIVAETSHIMQLDPDSETCWWLAACSICDEGRIDEKEFLKQLIAFEHLRTNPQARKEAAIHEYRKMVGLFRMQTFTHPDSGETISVPFGEEDGCIQGAYMKGHSFGVSHLRRGNGGEWYELGSFHSSLGLEDVPWTGTFRRNGKDYPNGPQYGAKNFVRLGDEAQLIRALFQVKTSNE